jgi:hypothetical protein
MMANPEVPWALITNHDVYAPEGEGPYTHMHAAQTHIYTHTEALSPSPLPASHASTIHTPTAHNRLHAPPPPPPGSLARLSAEVWAAYRQDPRLCVGLVRLQFDMKTWTAFVYTRRAVRALGFFDEVRVCVCVCACVRVCVCV